MPTGYTSSVQDGSITSLRDFALLCARAFGACVTLRDEPLVEAPTEIKADTSYHGKSLAEAKSQVEHLSSMSPGDRAQAASASYTEAHQSWVENLARKRADAARYEAVAAQVRSWTPPTSEHSGLKDFMLQQLNESVKFDCSENGKWNAEPVLKTAAEWHADALKQALREVEYHAKGRREEIERAEGRTAWLQALHASLPAVPA